MALGLIHYDLARKGLELCFSLSRETGTHLQLSRETDTQEAEDARVARALQAEEEERMSAAAAEKQRQEEEKAAAFSPSAEAAAEAPSASAEAAAALAEGARRVIVSTKYTHCLGGERARTISLSAPLPRQ